MAEETDLRELRDKVVQDHPLIVEATTIRVTACAHIEYDTVSTSSSGLDILHANSQLRVVLRGAVPLYADGSR